MNWDGCDFAPGKLRDGSLSADGMHKAGRSPKLAAAFSAHACLGAGMSALRQKAAIREMTVLQRNGRRFGPAISQ